MWPQLAQMNPQQLQQLMLQHFMQQQGAGGASGVPGAGMPAAANPLMQGGQGAMNPQLMALLPYLMRQQSAGAGQGAGQMNPQLMQMLMQHYMGAQGQGVPVQ